MKKKPVFKALLQRDGCEVRFTVLRQDARLMKRGHFIFKSSIGVEIISEQCPELFKESIFIRGFMRDKDKITSIFCFDGIAECMGNVLSHILGYIFTVMHKIRDF